MPTGAVTYYEQGSWKFCCAICGRTDLKSSQAMKYWTGIYTCPECWEARNAQELIRPVKDPQVVPWVARCGSSGCSATNEADTRVLDSMFVDELSLG